MEVEAGGEGVTAEASEAESHPRVKRETAVERGRRREEKEVQ